MNTSSQTNRFLLQANASPRNNAQPQAAINARRNANATVVPPQTAINAKPSNPPAFSPAGRTKLVLRRTGKKHTDGDCITRTVYETPEGKMYVKRRVNNSNRYQYIHVRYLNTEPNTHNKCMTYRRKRT